MPPRGIRNNNPGNIRLTQTKWQGETPVQADPDFVTFQTPEFGIRAMAKILLGYQAQGLATVREMVSRWAPASENDTGAYVQDVAAGLGVGPDAPVDFRHNPSLLISMVRAIIRHENGVQPYTDATLAQGVALA